MKRIKLYIAISLAILAIPLYGWNPFSASDWSDLGHTIQQGAEQAGEAIKSGAEQAASAVNQAVIQPTINEVVKPVVQEVIKPAIQTVVMPIAGPIIDKVGKPIFEKVIAPAINFVGDKIVDPVYQNTIAKIYDVKALLQQIATASSQVVKMLRDGATQLERSPDQFTRPIQQLADLPNQLDAGAKNVQNSIAQIKQTFNQIQTQRTSIEGQNLASKGLGTLNTNIMNALDQLTTALTKLAVIDPNTGQCSYPANRDPGVLCHLLQRLEVNKQEAEQNVTLLRRQVLDLKNKVQGNMKQGTLPTRMRDAASIIDSAGSL
ncbi:MAG TPA: hypothetical protein VFF04_02620 [Candidatus Babeliales bacterium]|nr:hypothetical protein [Candidatus Babeliales bacterium]